MFEIGPGFSEDHVLRDGTVVRVRPIRPEDGAELRRGFEGLSSESRYRRFLGGFSQLSDATLEYLTVVDGQDHVAVVATRPRGDGTEEGLGVGRFVRLRDDPAVAEAAITVVDGEQHKGIGRLLAFTLARAARERGVDRFRGEILANNEAVRQLLDQVGASLQAVEDGRIVFDVALEDTPSVLVEGKPKSGLGPLLRAASTWLSGLFRHGAV
jgi:GNAT superfamily N-acetyltransferase